LFLNFNLELEKMYYEILRVIDPDKQSNYSRTSAQSSTSLSSFSGSSTKEPSKKGSNRVQHHHSQQNLNMPQQRSSSNNNFNQTSPRTTDMK